MCALVRACVPECTHVCVHARVPCMYVHARPRLCMCEHVCALLSVCMYTRVPQVSFSKEGMEGPWVIHCWASGRAGMGPSPDPLWAEK